jgi:hypothetical protein
VPGTSRPNAPGPVRAAAPAAHNTAKRKSREDEVLDLAPKSKLQKPLPNTKPLPSCTKQTCKASPAVNSHEPSSVKTAASQGHTKFCLGKKKTLAKSNPNHLLDPGKAGSPGTPKSCRLSSRPRSQPTELVKLSRLQEMVKSTHQRKQELQQAVHVAVLKLHQYQQQQHLSHVNQRQVAYAMLQWL